MLRIRGSTLRAEVAETSIALSFISPAAHTTSLEVLGTVTGLHSILRKGHL